jgi:hypothetical protein
MRKFGMSGHSLYLLSVPTREAVYLGIVGLARPMYGVSWLDHEIRVYHHDGDRIELSTAHDLCHPSMISRVKC